MGFKEVLKTVSRIFEENKIPYMVIGGQAVLVYGEPRFTRDIDITIGVEPAQAEKIVEILEGFTPLVEDYKGFVEKTLVLPIIHNSHKIRVYVIFSFSEYEREAIKRARLVEVDGVNIRFASPEDLIIHKIIAGRPRDLEDIRTILNVVEKIDTRYIEKWLKFLGEGLNRDFLHISHSIKE